MTDKSLTKIEKNKALTTEQVNLIRRTVAKNATDDELAMFLHLCKEYGMDPFIRELCFIKRRVWNPYKKGYDEVPTIMMTRDGFLSIAHRTRQFDGMESDAIYDDKDNLTGAWCTVYRKDAKHPIKVKVKFSEYCVYNQQTKQPQALWKTKPETMIKKVAESQALRKAFNVHGLYAKEEMEAEIKADAKKEIEYADDAIKTAEKLYQNPEEYRKFSEETLTKLLESLESTEEPEELYRIEKSFEKDIRKLNNEDREYAQLSIDSRRESLISNMPYDDSPIREHIESKKSMGMPKDSLETPQNGTKAPETTPTPTEALDKQEKADKDFIQTAVSEVQAMDNVIDMKAWLEKNRPRIKKMLGEYKDYLHELFKGKWEKTDKSGQVKFRW